MKTNFVVTKHQGLIEASYKLNLEEQRLLLLCIAKIDSRKKMPEEITDSAEEYRDNFGIQLKHAYQQMKRAKDRLYERDIKLRTGDVSDRVRWVYHVTYHEGNGQVTLRFSPTIYPYLGQLNGLFKSYQLKNISSLKSVHAIRLYELLNQWRTSGKRFISIDDFKDMLQLEGKYERYTDLRKWVIEPSIREVSNKTDFNVSFKPEKRDRKVISLTFLFTEKSSGKKHQTLDFSDDV